MTRRRTGVALTRNPDLLVCWDGPQVVVRDLRLHREVRAPVGLLALLDRFSRPRRAEVVAREFPSQEGLVKRGIRRLVRLGLLLPADEARRRISSLAAWNGNVASAYYHVAARDQRYIQDAVERDAFLQARVAAERQPRRFKRFHRALRVNLPLAAPKTESLERVLIRRRTTRQFSRRPVVFEDLAAVVGGTWGRTGWIVAPPLGRLATKTSPSGGALHPIECYVIAWNVRGLRAGLYHFDVGAHELRRLRLGNFRAEAVRAASGQRWVGRAGFLCVMTGVFARTLWKYRLESAYRVLWLDAGHLAQTFCLLATSRGLGPFTTAAMQDSRIERLIGLDGVLEFPVYLCGAGVPSRPEKRKGPTSRPLPVAAARFVK